MKKNVFFLFILTLFFSCNTETYPPTKQKKGYDSYFKIQTIGGENSNYKVAFPAWYEYLDTVPYEIEPISMLNSFNGNFKKYIQNIDFSDSFKSKYDTDIEFKKYTDYTTDISIDYSENFDGLIDNLYDVCAPVFEDITENIQISDNAKIDKMHFLSYFNAINNEAYKLGCSDNFYNGSEEKKLYDETKADLIDGWNYAHSEESYNVAAPCELYQTTINQNGETCEVVNPQVVQQMNFILAGAANKMGVEIADLQNIINLALVRQTLDAVHDYTRITTKHSVHQENNLIDVIRNTTVTQVSTQNQISR